MEAIAWNSQPVLGCVNTQLSRHTAFAQGCEGTVEGMGDVAALFSAGGGDPDKVSAAPCYTHPAFPCPV
jgi:hypothetical protein